MPQDTCCTTEEYGIFISADKYGSAVYDSLREDLAGKGQSAAISKYAQRAAVFSGSLDKLGSGEIRVKKLVWSWLDRLCKPEEFYPQLNSASKEKYWMPGPHDPVKTLFTSVLYGGDSAAAEYFVNEKASGRDANIAFCPIPGLTDMSLTLKNFCNLSFFKKVGYTKKAEPGTNVSDSVGRFIADQCFHLLFIFANDSEFDGNGRVSRLFDYAITSHPGAIPHQIETLFLDRPDPDSCAAEPTGQKPVKEKSAIETKEKQESISVDTERQYEQLSFF